MKKEIKHKEKKYFKVSEINYQPYCPICGTEMDFDESGGPLVFDGRSVTHRTICSKCNWNGIMYYVPFKLFNLIGNDSFTDLEYADENEDAYINLYFLLLSGQMEEAEFIDLNKKIKQMPKDD